MAPMQEGRPQRQFDDNRSEPPAWWGTPPNDLSAVLAEIVAETAEEYEPETDLFWILFEYYNHLMASVKPRVAATHGDAVVAFFREAGDQRFEAMFLELVARTRLDSGDLDAGLAAFERMAEVHVADGQEVEVSALAQDVWAYAGTGRFSVDVQPVLLASVTRVFRTLKEPGPLAQTYLEAAELYSSSGASAAAARAMEDAVSVAREAGLEDFEAFLFGRAAAIAFEQQDAQRSVDLGSAAIAMYERLGKAVPQEVLINLATALIQVDELDRAVELYEAALDEACDVERGHILVNLALAYRLLGNLSAATKTVNDARAFLSTSSGREHRLELELIQARIDAEAGSLDTVPDRLVAACRLFDGQLSDRLRLHHRRGLRARYIHRFEGLLAVLPREGEVDPVLPILATIYGNLVGDWLAMLDWAEARQDDASLSSEDRTALAQAMQAVRAYGAPFLVGLQEKYDDPWSPAPLGRPWDRLGALIDTLVKNGVERPFARIGIDQSLALLKRRLAEGFCLCFPTFANDPGGFWVLHGGRYRRLDLDLKGMIEWRVARRRFEFGKSSRADFKEALDILLMQTTPVQDALAVLPEACPGVLLFQDYSDLLPLNAIALSHDALRGRVAAGDFAVKTIPALYAGAPEEAVQVETLTGVTEKNDGLRMTDAEIMAAAATLGTGDVRRIASDDADGLLDALAVSEMLIVSTHGVSVGRFTDPFFASLSNDETTHVINVDAIQRDFPDLGYKIVALNACHAGAAIARNYEQSFRTHDASGYPALLLLNRKSIVCAPSWTVDDVASFLQTVLMANGLAEGLKPALAFNRAIARLWDLTQTEAIALLASADQTLEVQAEIENLSRGPGSTQRFAHPFFCGGQTVYSLM